MLKSRRTVRRVQIIRTRWIKNFGNSSLCSLSSFYLKVNRRKIRGMYKFDNENQLYKIHLRTIPRAPDLTRSSHAIRRRNTSRERSRVINHVRGVAKYPRNVDTINTARAKINNPERDRFVPSSHSGRSTFRHPRLLPFARLPTLIHR